MCLPAARGYTTTSVTNTPWSCHSCIGKVGTQSSHITKSFKTQQALGSLLQESIPLWWNSQLSCAAKVARCQWNSKVGEEVKTVKLNPYFFTHVVIDPATLWYNNKFFFVLFVNLHRIEEIAQNSFVSWVQNMKGNCLGYVRYATSEIQKQIDAYTGELKSSHFSKINAVKIDHLTTE